MAKYRRSIDEILLYVYALSSYIWPWGHILYFCESQNKATFGFRGPHTIVLTAVLALLPDRSIVISFELVGRRDGFS